MYFGAYFGTGYFPSYFGTEATSGSTGTGISYFVRPYFPADYFAEWYMGAAEGSIMAGSTGDIGRRSRPRINIVT